MDINFKSFSLSPSDHECQEGDLAIVQNLVNEDGALQPIQKPNELATIVLDITTSNTVTSYNAAYAKFFIHTFDNDDINEDDNSNLIALIDDPTKGKHVLWCDGILNQNWKEMALLSGKTINAITATGRILNFVSDSETFWGSWRGSDYVICSHDDFGYHVKIEEESWERLFTVEVGTDYEGWLRINKGDLTDKTKWQTPGTTAEGTRALMDMLDAQVNEYLAGGNGSTIDPYTWNKYISLGFVAVRLYDGSNIAISDAFVIGGSKLDRDIRCNFAKDSSLKLQWFAELHKDTVYVQFDNLDKLGDIIEGVDIYLSSPSMYLKTHSAISFDVSTTALCPWNGSSAVGANLKLNAMDKSSIIEEIDNLPFTRSLHISKQDFSKGKVLKTQDDTNTALALGDFLRASYGGKTANNYNGRLLIGNFVSCMGYKPMANVAIELKTRYQNSGWHYWNGIGTPKPLYYYPTDTSDDYADVIYKVVWSDSFGIEKTSYFRNTRSQYPLPPILSIPYENAKTLSVYVDLWHDESGVTTHEYHCAENLELHQSETGSWAYYPSLINGFPAWFSAKYVDTYPDNTGTSDEDDGLNLPNDPSSSESSSSSSSSSASAPTEKTNTIWNDTLTESGFEALKVLCEDSNNKFVTRYRNRICVSDTDNPFRFSNVSFITVGNGKVMAMAAPTQPVSEGQAGQTPMVAFTSEGIYPLYINTNDGSIISTQPGPRDVVNNVDSITSIDDAIVFTTERGLMLFAGNKTECLTDNLRGKISGCTLPHFKTCYTNALDEELTTDYTNVISNYMPSISTLLEDCRVLYDYRSQRLLVYTKSKSWVLVYSLRSKAWGAAKYDYKEPINSYPRALATAKIGNTYKFVDAYQPTPAEVKIACITRPLGLGEPDTLKRIQSAIVRGYFQKGHVATALYGSRDLFNWYLINTSKDQYIRGRMGTPYKYFRVVALGKLDYNESIYGVSIDASGSTTNQQR